VTGENAAPTAPESELPAKRIRSALRTATAALLDELGPDGHWSGELSSSALSTATAVTALAAVDREAHREAITGGLRWLAAHANPDGGWGDTVRSRSNISTTALCWAAFGAAQADEQHRETVLRAGEWLERARGARPLWQAIEERYGKDRTFSVPILMTLALSGRLGADGWERVIPLPFELAALPHQVFGAIRLRRSSRSDRRSITIIPLTIRCSAGSGNSRRIARSRC